MKFLDESRKPVMTIGVAGSDRGVGATHFAIMLAGFLSSKEHKTTALIELNSAGDFEKLCRLYDAESNKAESFFLDGVDYYKRMDSGQIAKLFLLGYDYIILDLGQEWKSNQNEWMRCQTFCMVGSCTEWKVLHFEAVIEELERLASCQKKYYLTTFGKHELKKELERRNRVEILSIPVEATPFALHRKNLSFFGRFL